MRKKSPLPPTILTCPDLKVPSLPPEITDRIIDHLHGDLQSLRQCSLVCKVWLPRSRYHYFHSVILGNQSTCRRFVRLLDDNPNVGYCVKELKIFIYFEQPSWLASILPYIARRLPSVARLHLGGNGLYQALWFRHFNSVQELYMSSCTFESINEFIALLCYLPSLKDMYCSNVLVGDAASIEAPPITTTHPRPALRKLEVLSTRLDSKMFTEWLMEEGMHRSVEEIVLRPLQKYHLVNVGRFVKAIGPSLKRFEIALIALRSQGGFDDVFSTSFSFAPCTQLRSLAFGSPGGYSTKYSTDDPSSRWISSMLSQVTSPFIQDITFWIEDSDIICIRSEEWAPVFSILESEKFRTLKKVYLKLWGESKMLTDALAMFIREKLPRLDREGVLVFVRDERPPLI